MDAPRLAKGVYDTYYASKPEGADSDSPPTTGLSIQGRNFVLNGTKIRLLGGAIHYWRVPREYWRDRLRKMRAAGLNCLDTYIAWNLHERERGKYDFGENPDHELSRLLDVKSFLRTAQEEDLLVILRPGPYVCSELDLGGLPSWLLREEGIKLRSTDPKYFNPAKKFLNKLFEIVFELSFVNGGPIVAMQIENEYGVCSHDSTYLRELLNLCQRYFPASDTLFFTSDTPSFIGDLGSMPGVLQTANLQAAPLKEFGHLKRLQGEDFPLMVTEFWSGWFDHWLEKWHNKWPVQEFTTTLDEILKEGASVCFYMCHGGTNFGFTAGANVSEDGCWPYYIPDVTSYDYDCLISENGHYTKKYEAARKLLIPINDSLGIFTPEPPELLPVSLPKKYPTMNVTRIIAFKDILSQVPSIDSDEVLAMEDLPINDGSGQSFGYVVYQTKLALDSSPGELVLENRVRDLATLHLDGLQVSPGVLTVKDLDRFGSWTKSNASFQLPGREKPREASLEILVENCGRVNFGKHQEMATKKGLSGGGVRFNGKRLKNWKIYPLEFKANWLLNLKSWQPYSGEPTKGPAIVEGDLFIDSDPQDTFLDVTPFGRKGATFINGINLGRFWSAGPQQTLYLPGAFLKKGPNKVTVFLQYQSEGSEVRFLDEPNLGPDNPSGLTPGSTGKLICIEEEK